MTPETIAELRRIAEQDWVYWRDEATEKLHAALPELLDSWSRQREALERLLPLAESWADGVGRSHPDHEVIEEARAALAPATREGGDR